VFYTIIICRLKIYQIKNKSYKMFNNIQKYNKFLSYKEIEHWVYLITTILTMINKVIYYIKGISANY